MSPAERPVFSRSAEQPRVPFLGAEERLLLTGEQTAGEFALLRSAGERGHAAPWHRHLRASETFVVLEGRIVFRVGDEEQTIGEGDAVLLPRMIPHGFVVASAGARWLTIHTPSGFDAFVRAVGDATTGPAGPDRAALAAIALEHGIEILGPPIPIPPDA